MPLAFYQDVKLPLQVSFHGMAPSPAVEAAIREKAAKLDEFYDRIMACRVAVEAPHRHHRKGRHYRVRVDLTVPGDEIVVGRDPAPQGAHADVYVAVRDSFDAARRLLQDYVRRLRGQVKARAGPTHARIAYLAPDESHGFLETEEGRRVYFHRNSVVDGFERLAVGNEVRFAEEPGDSGPQASTVFRVGRSGRHELKSPPPH